MTTWTSRMSDNKSVYTYLRPSLMSICTSLTDLTSLYKSRQRRHQVSGESLHDFKSFAGRSGLCSLKWHHQDVTLSEQSPGYKVDYWSTFTDLLTDNELLLLTLKMSFKKKNTVLGGRKTSACFNFSEFDSWLNGGRTPCHYCEICCSATAWWASPRWEVRQIKIEKKKDHAHIPS